MRPFWTGTIGFGLVNIPVKVSTAVSEESLGFSMVHAADESPIHYRKVCERGHEVAKEDIVKAYKLEDGHQVVLTDDDFRRASIRKTSSMDIVCFIQQGEVDPVYYDKPYYLDGTEDGEAAYALLRDALTKSEMVALVRYVFRNHESLGLILPRNGGLILYQLRYKFQIRTDASHYPAMKTGKREMTIALALIEKMTASFDPEAYHDTYRDDLKRLIAAKVKGQELEPQPEEPLPTNVIDLMAMLKKSLGQNRHHAHGERTSAAPAALTSLPAPSHRGKSVKSAKAAPSAREAAAAKKAKTSKTAAKRAPTSRKKAAARVRRAHA